ncbi:MAG: prepilin-type N-terminal cleavage/methylation domain-containing protein [SAR92 clade bacterium]|uniref:Prepilin-type N-terminal cleavage/methylation domain-containing protein n=1 Tax=SAR92 clade bacterium TaxID=2315479 RepID=A0A520MI12_9GAMM|nr:MAG: prepilin-type N-terminal cleavage/methylation domain-containing protein [SAR92 clade bacterium]
MKYSKGFTLIELLVVVAIVVILALASIIAVNQSADRRYPAEAEKLLIWLQQIAQRSSLEGAAYGLVAKIEEDSQATIELQPVIYYRKRWLEVSSPEPFVIDHNGIITWDMESIDGDELMAQSRSVRPQIDQRGEVEEEEVLLLPEIAFLPDGYVEPEGVMQLSFNAYKNAFNYQWDDSTNRMIMELVESSR